MNVIRFDQPVHFVEKITAYLEVEESLNGLILGLAFRLAQKAPRRRNRPFLAVVEADGELMATAVMTPPRKLILYSHLADCRPALRALWTDLQDSHWTVPGVLGPANVADTWAAMWQMENSDFARYGMRQRVYELRQVNSLSLPAGQLRLADADDFEQVVDWIQSFHQDVHIQDNLESAELLARQKMHNGDLFLWENEAREVVTMAAKSRPTPHGISISLVFTPENLRGLGYATACVATLSQQLLQEGYQFCTLFTDLDNPVSNHIYEKIGFTAVADFNEYNF
ncbi:MAG: GNAT family N-acetyltransferase [Chloroflexi bacterium]|nr:GNAT family N-acetyltransferase [Chloroflexota bacterium]